MYAVSDSNSRFSRPAAATRGCFGCGFSLSIHLYAVTDQNKTRPGCGNLTWLPGSQAARQPGRQAESTSQNVRYNLDPCTKCSVQVDSRTKSTDQNVRHNSEHITVRYKGYSYMLCTTQVESLLNTKKVVCKMCGAIRIIMRNMRCN